MSPTTIFASLAAKGYRLGIGVNRPPFESLDHMAEAQSDDKILSIHNQWKSAPLIKWKESISEVVEKHQKN